MFNNSFLKQFLIWRYRNISDRTFILVLSAFIGFASGLAAVLLKNAVHLIKATLLEGLVRDMYTYLFFLFPIIGIILTIVVIKYIIKRKVADGVPSTLYTISRQNGIMKPHHMYSSIITSALTVGFGGSVGLEGPAIATGSAIGSNISRLLKLNYKTTILFIGCAASGAMGAIFNAPIAALIFSLEVIMLDLTLSSLIPLLIASFCASLTSYFFLGNDVLFHITLKETFLLKDIPFYILLGITAGVVSLYFTKTNLFLSKQIGRIKNNWIKAIICGIILGDLIYSFPALYGEGYDFINTLLAGNFNELLNNSLLSFYTHKAYIIPLLFIMLVLLKSVATTVTLSAGGNGGLFAPSLFTGSMLGFLFAFVVNDNNISTLSVTNFTLAGMAGTIAGIMHAPLTAIFLVAELTGGSQLFIPLMITSAISYITIKSFEPHSIYTLQLAKRGDLITHHKDKTVLTLLKLEKVIEKNFISVKPDERLRDLVVAIKSSARNIFPVVDDDNNFLGLVPLDNIRDIMFDQEMYDKVYIRDLMIDPPTVIALGDQMEEVMNKLKSTGLWNLPVVDKGKYLGFVSRANIFNAYRQLLIEVSED